MERCFLVVISTLINHDRDFIYQSRGYSTVREMNESIVEVCNQYIDDDDDFYILGDCIMGYDLLDGLSYMRRLHGRKHIIRGNHDTDRRVDEFYRLPNTDVLGEAKTIRRINLSLFLCHYPTAFSPVGPFYRANRLCLCGHTHTTDPWSDIQLGSFHVEWDAWHRPVEVEEIITMMQDFNERVKGDNP